MNEQSVEHNPAAIKKFVKNFALIDVVDENEKSMLVPSKNISKNTSAQEDEEKEDRQA